MKLGYLIKRGANLLKLGLAARQIRKSTSEEQHQRAKKYLVELLGKSRGLPTKIGQFITMDSDDHALRESLIDSIVPMPFHEVTEILGLAYGDSSVFKKLDKEPKVASLGQVHFGTLKDGTEVAVKIQYSEIAGAVESEATTLPEIIQEMLLTKTSERQGRVIDQDEGGAGMQRKKERGYF